MGPGSAEQREERCTAPGTRDSTFRPELTKPMPSTMVRPEPIWSYLMTTGTAPTDFAKRLDQTAEDTEALLSKLLSDALLPDEIARPKRLMDAMRYSSL